MFQTYFLIPSVYIYLTGIFNQEIAISLIELHCILHLLQIYTEYDIRPFLNYIL